MRGFELVKREDHWALYNEDGHKIAATLPGCNSKLSIKNCEAIVNGYDLDELACKEIGIDISVINHIDKKMIENSSPTTPINEAGAVGAGLYHQVKGFEIGFQKALELLGDKKFSINEVVELCKILMSNPFEKCGKTYQELTDNYIQSLQQTEWEVEIVMEYQGFEEDGKVREAYLPKLDAEGCLILKRI